MYPLIVGLLLIAASPSVIAQDTTVFDPWSHGTPQTQRAPIQMRVALQPLPATFPAWVLQRVFDPWAATPPTETIRPQERRLTLAARAHARAIAHCFERAFDNYRVDIHFGRQPAIADAARHPVLHCLDKVMTHLDLRRPPRGAFTLVLGAEHGRLQQVFVVESSRLN